MCEQADERLKNAMAAGGAGSGPGVGSVQNGMRFFQHAYSVGCFGEFLSWVPAPTLNSRLALNRPLILKH